MCTLCYTYVILYNVCTEYYTFEDVYKLKFNTYVNDINIARIMIIKFYL